MTIEETFADGIALLGMGQAVDGDADMWGKQTRPIHLSLDQNEIHLPPAFPRRELTLYRVQVERYTGNHIS
jgi:hypothetical protein